MKGVEPKIRPGPTAAPFICQEIESKAMEEVSNELQHGKSSGSDGNPYKYYENETVLFRER